MKIDKLIEELVRIRAGLDDNVVVDAIDEEYDDAFSVTEVRADNDGVFIVLAGTDDETEEYMHDFEEGEKHE